MKSMVMQKNSVDGFIAEAKMLRLFQLLRCMHDKPRTIKQFSELLDMHERTVYRYIAIFEYMGFPIEKSFDKKFFIVENDNCPLCGKHQTPITNENRQQEHSTTIESVPA